MPSKRTYHVPNAFIEHYLILVDIGLKYPSKSWTIIHLLAKAFTYFTVYQWWRLVTFFLNKSFMFVFGVLLSSQMRNILFFVHHESH